MIALDAVTPLSQIPEKPRKVIRMQTGGDPEKKLAEGPPENIDMLPRFEGFEPGPNQFMLQEEETVIPSEPSFDTGKQEFPGPGMKMQDFIFNTPSIRPQEVYPMDPDPGIMGILPTNDPPFLQANLQNVGNNGIMDFDLIRKLNYEKPVGSYPI